MKQNFEKAANKSKPEDLKHSRGPTSVDKKEISGASPNSENASKPASDQKKAWVLASSTPQTKPFEGQNSALAESQKVDSDEKPQVNTENPVPKTSGEDDKVYKIKDNPFVRGSTPNKNQPEVKKLTNSREGIATRRTVEERQVIKKTQEEVVVTKQETITSSTLSNKNPANHRYSVAPSSQKTAESDIRRSSVTGSSTGPSKPLDRSSVSKEKEVAKPSTSTINTDRTDRSKSRPTNEKPAKPSAGLKGSVADGYHSLEYENGTYEGYIKANKRHGKGKYTWKDGNWYEGDWVDDLKDGTGKFSWTTGDCYEGEYKKDKREGAGIKIYANGDKYEVDHFNV